MAKKLIHYDLSRLGCLHCDNPKCDYVDEDPREFTPDLIGTPCPKCGESLLTEQDFAVTIRSLKMIRWVNKWFGWLGTEEPPPDAVRLWVRHANGKTTVETKDPST